MRERLNHEKAAIGFCLTGHLFDEAAGEVRRFVPKSVAELAESRQEQLVAGVVGDMRVINTQRGRLAIFRLDDGSATVEATCDERALASHRNLLREDEVVVLRARVQNDRVTGGLRLAVQQAWDLAGARCRFAKYLRVAVNGRPPDVARLLREFPPRREMSEQGELLRGLGVVLAVRRDGEQGGAAAELQLGDEARFFPSDDALAGWIAQADQGQASVVYD